jgi:hypothetical protein
MVHDLETMRVAIQYKKIILLLGGFYRPPKANNEYWNFIEEGFDRAYNTREDNLIITGDLNIDLRGQNRNKLEHLIKSYNLTESSFLLIDVKIVKNTSSLLTYFVGDPFVPDLIRYYCPIIGVFTHYEKPRVHSFKRTIWI